jgi:hypothetical protein
MSDLSDDLRRYSGGLPPDDDKPKKGRRPLSFGDVVGILALVIAVITYLVGPNWRIGVLLALVVIGLFVYAARRHPGSLIVRALVAGVLSIVFVCLIWPSLWESFRKDYPKAQLNWPIALNPPSTERSSAHPTTSPTPAPAPTASPPERVIVDVSLQTLVDFYRGNRSGLEGDRLAAPYIGKWKKISGEGMSVQSVGDGVLISFFIDPMSAALLYFDPKWKERLQVMSAHPKVSALCQITLINGGAVKLEHCEPI